MLQRMLRLEVSGCLPARKAEDVVPMMNRGLLRSGMVAVLQWSCDHYTKNGRSMGMKVVAEVSFVWFGVMKVSETALEMLH